MGRERVVILGAGVAGLTAAHELLQRKFDVLLVDSRLEPGGKARSYLACPWAPGTTTSQTKPLPAEHGFRFFPGFYRHLDATMKKIPRDPDDPRAGSVFDNLVPIGEELLAVTGKHPIRVPAKAPRGPRLVDAFRSILQFPKDLLGVGLTREDLELFANKLWQFATSSPARRDVEYESLGWREFIQSLDRSDEYYWYLATGLTRVLVAAKGRKASTKTIGDVGLQLLLCMTERENTTDRVLNGPTNEVWFVPWIKHLKHLAQRNSVTFEYRYGTKVEAISVAGGAVSSIRLSGNETLTTPGQVICALPVDVLAGLIKRDDALLAAGNKAFERLADKQKFDPEGDPENPKREKIENQFSKIINLGDGQYLERMTGMQLYFKKDVKINPGHQIFPDSPWGLTSISQRQFWNDKRVEEWLPDGRGVLSIDISSWDLPGMDGLPEAMKADLPTIYKGTLKQLRGALGPGVLMDDNIDGWHLDGVKDNKPDPDLERILVNHVGTAALRPTAQTAISNLFLAGDYVRTRTDLACMEGANESARHAVNGLLDALGAKDERCETFDPREKEPAALEYLQQMDDYRFKRGLPWGGVSLGDWMVRAGWAADSVGDVLLADDKADESTRPLEPTDGTRNDAPPDALPQPYRRPRDQWVLEGTNKKTDHRRRKDAVADAVAHAQPVSNDVLPKAFAAPGRVDPAFLRWPLYRIHVEENSQKVDYIIPFIVYDADAVIVHGKAMNFDYLESWTKGTGGDYHPAYCLENGKKVGYAELWMVRYNDTVGGPYDELVINFVVNRRRSREYRWRSPYSSLVPMMDPDNRLFTIRLLVDERVSHKPPAEDPGPIKFGNELFGTDKREARITFKHERSRRFVRIAEQDVEKKEKPVETLKLDVDFEESAVSDATDYIELAREIGVIEAMRVARQGWRGDTLDGGLITPDFRTLQPKEILTGVMPKSTIEILAAYKYNPKLSLGAAKHLIIEPNAPKGSFGELLNAMGFKPQIAALDDHLKSILYLEDWPTAGRPAPAAGAQKPSTTSDAGAHASRRPEPYSGDPRPEGARDS